MSATATVGYVIGASIGLCVVYYILRAIVIGSRACFSDFLKTFCFCFDQSGEASSPKAKRLPREEPPAPDLTGLKQTKAGLAESDTDTMHKNTTVQFSITACPLQTPSHRDARFQCSVPPLVCSSEYRASPHPLADLLLAPLPKGTPTCPM